MGFALALAGFLVYSTVQGMFYLQAIQILFWLIVSASAVGLRATAPAVVAVPVRRLRPAPVAAAAVVATGAIQAVVAAPLFERAEDTIARQPRGFYQAEPGDPGWRWSTGEGTLCLHPEGTEMELRVAAGDPRPAEYPRTVTIRLDDVVVDRFLVPGPGVISRDLDLPPAAVSSAPTAVFGECAGAAGEVRLTVEVDQTWSPLAEGLGTDPRTLGVQLFEPTYRPAPEAPVGHPQ
jgi:hypothetical protein